MQLKTSPFNYFKPFKALNFTAFFKNFQSFNYFYVFLFFILLTTGAFILGFLFLLSKQHSLNLFLQQFSFIFQQLDLINLIFFAFIILIVYFLISRAHRRYIAQEFGIRLSIKLGFFFAVVGVIPSLLLGLTSYYYVQKSFQQFVNTSYYQQGFSAANQLNHILFERLLNEQREYAFSLVRQFKNAPDQKIEAVTDQLRKLDQNTGLYQLSLIQNRMNEEPKLLYGALNQIDQKILDEAKNNKAYAKLEANQNNLQIRVVLPLNFRNDFIQITQVLPKDWIIAHQKILNAQSQHLKNHENFRYLNQIYLFLSLSIFLFTIALATLLALILGAQILRPLLMINQNTNAANHGHMPILEGHEAESFDPKHQKDELVFLSQAFNHMIYRIQQERSNLQKNRDQLNEILSSMSSGILVFDQNYRLIKYNLIAQEILGLNLEPHLNQSIITSHYHEGNDLQHIYQLFANMFELNMRWEKQKEYHFKNIKKYLLLRGSVLIYQNTRIYTLVFDDISQLLSAEKAAAWAEVAQRLAHEIKNPLTPIQLSAERLQIKLQGKLDEKLEQIVFKSTEMIINQVAALKYLVDEFRNYARLPQALFQAVQLNDLIKEVMQLYITTDRTEFKLRLQENLPMVLIDPEQIRQVLHNLIKNAQEAMQNSPKDEILIRTQLQVDPMGNRSIHLLVRDSGPGFSEKIIGKVFEPYITTKSTGTGLGMAIVKKIIDENHAKISINNQIDENTQQAQALGAEIHIWFKLFDEEKREQ